MKVSSFMGRTSTQLLRLFLFDPNRYLKLTVIVGKENRRLNELEIHLLTKMKSLPCFRKFADELLLELIATSTIQPRTEEEINNMCNALYQGLCELDEQENQDKKSHTH